VVIKVKQMSISITHRRKPPLMRLDMACVTGITQFYLPTTRLSMNGINHPAHCSLINLDRTKG